MRRDQIYIRRRSAPLALVAAGLAAQLVGAGTQGIWRGLLAERADAALTEGRTFWIDHIISNAGVACLLVGSVVLHRRFQRAESRVVLTGAAIETLGALLDTYSHVQGGENQVAFGLIGTGFILAAGGAASLGHRRHSSSSTARWAAITRTSPSARTSRRRSPTGSASTLQCTCPSESPTFRADM